MFSEFINIADSLGIPIRRFLLGASICLFLIICYCLFERYLKISIMKIMHYVNVNIFAKLKASSSSSTVDGAVNSDLPNKFDAECENSNHSLTFSLESLNFDDGLNSSDNVDGNTKKFEQIKSCANAVDESTSIFDSSNDIHTDSIFRKASEPESVNELNTKSIEPDVKSLSQSSGDSDVDTVKIGSDQVSIAGSDDRSTKRPIRRYKKAKTTQLINPIIKITDCDLGTTKEIKDLDWLIEHTKPTKPWYFRSAEAYQTSISNNYRFSGSDKDLESEAKAVIDAIENPVDSSDSLEDIPKTTAKFSKPISAKDVSGIPVSRRLVLKYRGSKSLPFAADVDQCETSKEKVKPVVTVSTAVQSPTRVPRPIKKYGAKRSEKARSQTEKLKMDKNRDSSISRSSAGEYTNDVTYRENRAYHWRKKALVFKNYMEETKPNVYREIGAEKQRFHYAELKGSEVIYGNKPVKQSGKGNKSENSHVSENDLSLSSS